MADCNISSAHHKGVRDTDVTSISDLWYSTGDLPTEAGAEVLLAVPIFELPTRGDDTEESMTANPRTLLRLQYQKLCKRKEYKCTIRILFYKNRNHIMVFKH